MTYLKTKKYTPKQFNGKVAKKLPSKKAIQRRDTGNPFAFDAFEKRQRQKILQERINLNYPDSPIFGTGVFRKKSNNF